MSPVAEAPGVSVGDIHRALRQMGGWGSVYVPEFTWKDLRADAVLIDVHKRWIRGFEVKVSHGDFARDQKWTLYSQFVSSLTVACPWGIIQPQEVASPFGLLWVRKVSGMGNGEVLTHKWMKRPANFQRRDSLSWLWTYVQVIERELPRLAIENAELRRRRDTSHMSE